MKHYTKQIREAIVAVLRSSYPMPMTTQQIALEMPWGKRIMPYSQGWPFWEDRDDMTLLGTDTQTRTVLVAMRPFSSEVYNSLRALEKQGKISRTPREPGRRDRMWTYLPDPKVDNEIHELDRLWEMS